MLVSYVAGEDAELKAPFTLRCYANARTFIRSIWDRSNLDHFRRWSEIGPRSIYIVPC